MRVREKTAPQALQLLSHRGPGLDSQHLGGIALGQPGETAQRIRSHSSEVRISATLLKSTRLNLHDAGSHIQHILNRYGFGLPTQLL